MKKIAVLTSSRADYGIYLPLLKALKSSETYEPLIVAFGTHLSAFHGYTLQQIEADGFDRLIKVESLILGDSEEAIATSMAATTMKFAAVWARLKDTIDLIFCLGDRYEMFAAVAASVPFNIPVAHIHGGETTLGAIDNKFRHAMTQLATYHFTSTAEYSRKVIEMTGAKEKVFCVGALSLDGIDTFQALDKDQFLEAFKIDLRKPTILLTFHPETVAVEKNKEYADEIADTVEALTDNYQVLITMPNADTRGTVIRDAFQKVIDRNPGVIGVESLGKRGYFSCMKHCSFLLGNTSSGIIEAASFGKYVINLGDRQKGRTRSGNVLDVTVSKTEMLEAVAQIEQRGSFRGENIYKKGESAREILHTLNLLNG